MAAKKSMSAMDFIVAQLQKNKNASYAEIKAAADKKGLLIYPINYGRAQAMLGLAGGKKKKAKKAGKKRVGRPKGSGRKGGRRKATARSSASGTALDTLQDLVGSMKEQQRVNDDLRRTLEKVRELIDRVV